MTSRPLVLGFLFTAACGGKLDSASPPADVASPPPPPPASETPPPASAQLYGSVNLWSVTGRFAGDAYFGTAPDDPELAPLPAPIAARDVAGGKCTVRTVETSPPRAAGASAGSIHVAAGSTLSLTLDYDKTGYGGSDAEGLALAQPLVPGTPIVVRAAGAASGVRAFAATVPASGEVRLTNPVAGARVSADRDLDFTWSGTTDESVSISFTAADLIAQCDLATTPGASAAIPAELVSAVLSRFDSTRCAGACLRAEIIVYQSATQHAGAYEVLVTHGSVDRQVLSL